MSQRNFSISENLSKWSASNHVKMLLIKVYPETKYNYLFPSLIIY